MGTLFDTPVPQVIFAEQWTNPSIVVNDIGPQSDLSGYWATFANSFVRSFTLQFAVITSAECASLAQFYTQQRGPWLAFQFPHPVNGTLYTVRFGGGLDVELFTPLYFQATPLTLVVVTS